ncbi:hypothetical protein Bca52824_030991 [Brassica carinata]|uniref:Uncharacterized protein n=1 Tax=Brassica carinata TaxID=52824 RepID=A0A8X7V3R2_BRACI|nr:hypothetical protein Bca52824_030991 [Brassica carinata]
MTKRRKRAGKRKPTRRLTETKAVNERLLTRLFATSKPGNRIMSSINYVAKDISLGIGAWAAMLEGVFEVAQAVKVTMGPSICKSL